MCIDEFMVEFELLCDMSVCFLGVAFVVDMSRSFAEVEKIKSFLCEDYDFL